MRQADLVLVGADSLTQQGVVNKVRPLSYLRLR